ncbi:hypothetical protein [Leifsonia sp. 22587]|uniref:hypothetical protein n=1 Tax=Leifsonia sp. 22587 TaxID=3453946 RepID=UPI003F872CC2
MTDCQVWARIIGTGLQLLGLVLTGVGLSNTYREFRRHNPDSFAAKITRTVTESVERVRDALVRGEKPPKPRYTDSEIGSVSVTLRDPLEDEINVDPNLEVAEQVRALTELAQEHRAALVDLETERRKVAVALEQVVKDVQKVAADAQESVRRLALGGLPLAVVGLGATFVGTLVAAFS